MIRSSFGEQSLERFAIFTSVLSPIRDVARSMCEILDGSIPACSAKELCVKPFLCRR